MRAVAILCFFLSGASGLIFEVIWTRMFSLVFGATTLAISTVLTAFMGGLALGSYLSGRYADRIQDTLKIYALAEAGIGLCALAVPLVVGEFDTLNSYLHQNLSSSYAVLGGVRFLASAVVMIIPTTLMGATLPLLSRYFVQTDAEQAKVGFRVGTLYAVNTFGAVLGTFLGGFVLLPHLGLSLTNTLAGCTNLVLAVVVFAAYQIRRRLPAPQPMSEEVAELMEEFSAVPPVKPDVPPRARSAALVAFGISGGVAMVYQVIWTRTLSMTMGSSVYSFTLVLVAFLIGLAGGAAVIARMANKTRNPVGWLAVNHLVIVVLVGASFLMADRLPMVFLFFLKNSSLNDSSVMWAHFGMALVTMLPATFAMGGIFPLTIRIYSSNLPSVGQDVGNVYSINTVGAIVGSFLAGFVVIPVLQLQPGTFTAACLNLAAAVVLAWLAPWPRSRRYLVSGGAVALVVVALLLPGWNIGRLSAGLFRLSIARNVLSAGKWEDGGKLVFHKDGICTSVTVEHWAGDHYSMKNNGKVDASTGDDMPTQISVGLLPLVLHPGTPRLRPKVALVGYASGVTAGAILQYPVSRLDVVELEPAIIEASRWFEHVNNRPLDDKRLRLIMDDGRNFLAASGEKYDVIINEPSNPWITGVSNLFTREYFEIGKRRLAADGVFITWAQMYEISPRSIKTIYRTFSEVFPYVTAFSAEALSSDTFLVGSNRPLKMDIQRMRRVFSIPSVKAEMKRARIERPDDLIALTLLGPSEIRAFTLGAPINTDDNAIIEFSAPRNMLNHRRYDYYVSNVYGQSWIYGHLSPLVTGYRSSEDYADLVHSLLKGGKLREARVFFEKVDKEAGPRSLLVARLLDMLETYDVTETEVPLDEGGGGELAPLKVHTSVDPKKAAVYRKEYRSILRHTRRKAFRTALAMVEKWDEQFCEDAGNDFNMLWGYLDYKGQHFHQAVKILEPLWSDDKFVKHRPALLYYLGRSFYGNADYAKSVKTMEQWIAYRVKTGLPVTPPRAEDHR